LAEGTFVFPSGWSRKLHAITTFQSAAGYGGSGKVQGYPPGHQPVARDFQAAQLKRCSYVHGFAIFAETETAKHQVVDIRVRIYRRHESNPGNFAIGAQSAVRNINDELLPASRIPLMDCITTNNNGMSLNKNRHGILLGTNVLNQLML
jgi:hypothetical protein